MARTNSLSLESMGVDLPYNMQAEQSVLGAAMLKPDLVLTDLITRLRPEMFYSAQNRAVFEEMGNLFTEGDQGIDLVTLMDAVGRSGAFDSADDAKVYLTSLAETVPSISNYKAYADIVEEKYKTRLLMEVARKILERGTEGPDADQLLENAEQEIYAIRTGQGASATKQLRDAIIETLGNLQRLSGPDAAKYAGIPTGFRYLDAVLTGLGRSDLIILAARPGMGKTSFALNIATNVAKQQKVPVAVFSLEMTCEQLADRILSSEAGVDSQAFRTGRLSGEDWRDLAHASDVLCDAPIFIDDSSGLSVAEMKAKIRQLNQDPKRDKIGLVVVDYLQLMTTGKRTENRVQEISEITRNLKITAKELNVPIIVLSQLSRSVEKNGSSSRRPQLSDLRDSGSIEQDADAVLFLYREAYYNRQNSEDNQADENVAECIVAKNRHGETATVQLGWDGAHTRFLDVDLNHANDR